MAKQSNTQESKQPWQSCHYCPLQTFKGPQEFVRHLRERHCSKEGGSYVCRYGYNGVCPSLPLDGVSDRDYESHVTRHHVNPVSKGPEQWSVYSAAQNLPAVLNDPNRGKQAAFFTKIWGDSFVEKTDIPQSAFLPEISWEHFEPYVRKVGRRIRRHSRISQAKLEAAPSLRPFSGDVTEFDLKEIPNIFLKQDMDLSDSSTFNSVYPSNICETQQQSYQSGRLLQEKLSHYMDIVEVQIAHQVSQKSSAFFHAMTSHDVMMDQMNQATNNIRSIRSKIQNIDGSLVKDSLKILSLERSRCNHNSVLEKLKLMATVHQTQPMIQLLLSAPDYVAALDLISTTQEILSQELAGVHSFRHLPSQLTEMERLIDKMLNTEFERYAAADLNRPLTEDTRVLEADKLISIISGLLRKKNFNFIDTYKEEAITTVKAIHKQMVIEVIQSSDAEICLTGSGEQVSLSLNEWVLLLETATRTLDRLIHRVKAVHDVMRHTADSSAGKITGNDDIEYSEGETFLSSAEHEVVEEKLKDLLISMCDYCHERCGSLVSNQTLDKNAVSANQIVRLSEIVNTFSRSCEAVCGKQSVILRAAFKTQAMKYVQRFHNDKRSKLALLLDSEQWKQAEVPSEFQSLVDNISVSGFNNVKKESESERPPSNVLMVDGEPYTVVGTALLLIQIVSEYCKCASQLTTMSGQISRNLVDLLRTFNSRCCQLVLGAGALHVAGLKIITSANLALVSRALQLVLWLLPHVKNHFQQLEVNGTQLEMTGYNAIEKDLIGHIQEIGNKVSTIVCTLVSTQLSNWDARPPVPSQPFRNISKHFVKLHEAISPILPETQVHSLYKPVHKNFKDKLREQLLKNNIVNNGGPQHGVVTSELMFYLETLRTLKALPENEITDKSMDDIWLKS